MTKYENMTKSPWADGFDLTMWDVFCMKVDPKQYDYVMYVDASGDDGFQFDNGSTSCYVASAFLVKQEDIPHNLGILQQIKQTIGCKPTDEVKYSRIRRHRRGPEALQLLRDLRGKMSCYIIFKKELPVEEQNKTDAKVLSVSCHAMALSALDAYSFQDGETVLVAIDRMKHTEEAPLEYALKTGFLSDRKHPERNFVTETVFRDSKDSCFLLIQIADLLCGTIREHFEQYEISEDMQYFRAKCPYCKKLMLMKKSATRPLCRNGRNRSTQIFNSKNMMNIYHLIPNVKSPSMFDFFFMNPTKMMDQHFYMICKKI